MKGTRMFAIWIMVLGLMACPAKFLGAVRMSTAFTYQGRLIDANEPADGLYDFQFKLYDADADVNQVGLDVNKPNEDVVDGYFAVELDFGSNVFTGEARWLQVGVRPGDLNDPNVYTILNPRQEITPVPYALQTRGIFVDDTGNVGIGTTTPVEKLEVNGDAKLKSIELGQGDIRDRGSIRIIIDRDNDQTDQTFSVWRDGEISPPGAELFRIQENGNVGIGTTSPAYTLHIAPGTISNTGGAYFATATGAKAGVGTIDPAAKWDVIDENGLGTNDLAFRVKTRYFNGVSYDIPLDAIAVTQKGNVGIGTISPSEKLHVAGKVRIVDGSEGSGKVLTSDANGVASWQSPPTGALPRGVIVMWWGLTSNVPSGWALCDRGTYTAPDGASVQTPDLRDRFIVGARQDDGDVAKTNVKGSLMQTGGEHEHTLTIAEMPSHTHEESGHGGWPGRSEDDPVGAQMKMQTGPAGDDQPHENCPPFYALAFIMKL